MESEDNANSISKYLPVTYEDHYEPQPVNTMDLNGIYLFIYI